MSQVMDTRRRDDILGADMRKETIDKQYNLSGDVDQQNKLTPAIHQSILKGIVEWNRLSTAFFSLANIKIIQNAIRSAIHAKIGKIIAEQDERELLIIMRSMYLQFSINSTEDYDIKKEIEWLNGLVLKQCIPSVLEAIDMHEYYLKHHFNVPEPFERPINDNVRGTINNTFMDPGI
jgi:hypothetical protein